jgi:hypothetical protein
MEPATMEFGMNIGDFLDFCTNYAYDYRGKAIESIWRNRHMNELREPPTITQIEADALLVDFINFMGMRMGCDYALYTKGLDEPPRKIGAST